ncbi:30S ribosomal protein S2 [Candidatus Saccharibacteria bacterium]|nr:30S ribosomal protein S2 [Candidatus Saccharibacteria bacterium]
MTIKKTKTKAKATRLAVPTPEKLLEAGVHLGHVRRRWHPKMEPFIYTEREGVHVFDLYKTQEKLKEAAQFLRDTAQQGGKVLFVGTKRQAREIVEAEAKRVGAFFIVDRWLGGLVTNFSSVKKNIERLEELKRKAKDKEFEHYTKKEQLMIKRQIAKLERQVGGLTGMRELPDALVLASVRGEDIAAREGQQKGISVVGIADTNADPSVVDYLIPGNDDSATSIEIIIKTLADAVEAGKK